MDSPHNTEILTEQLEKWSEMHNLQIARVSKESFARATNAVISAVVPIRPGDLEDWLLYDRHRADFVDWMPYFSRSFGHEIRIYYVNVNPNSSSYDNFLTMRCLLNLVFVDERNDVEIIKSESFAEE